MTNDEAHYGTRTYKAIHRLYTISPSDPNSLREALIVLLDAVHPDLRSAFLDATLPPAHRLEELAVK